jgi:DNA repair protein RadC
MHPYEMLELLLSYAIPRKDVKPPAKGLIQRFGNLKEVIDADYSDLIKEPGLGPAGAILIKLVKDLTVLYFEKVAVDKKSISSSRELMDYCQAAFGGRKNECFSVIYQDSQNRVLQVETIHEGIVNQAVVYPRRILEGALQCRASALIMVHNHPSGVLRPSQEDINLTKTVIQIAQAMQIRVNDHLIIGADGCFSFREEGIVF